MHFWGWSELHFRVDRDWEGFYPWSHSPCSALSKNWVMSQTIGNHWYLDRAMLRKNISHGGIETVWGPACALTFLPLIQEVSCCHMGLRNTEMIGVRICFQWEQQQVRGVKMPQKREKTNSSLLSLHCYYLPVIGSQVRDSHKLRCWDLWKGVENIFVYGNRLSCIVMRYERSESCIWDSSGDGAGTLLKQFLVLSPSWKGLDQLEYV